MRPVFSLELWRVAFVVIHFPRLERNSEMLYETKIGVDCAVQKATSFGCKFHFLQSTALSSPTSTQKSPGSVVQNEFLSMRTSELTRQLP